MVFVLLILHGGFPFHKPASLGRCHLPGFFFRGYVGIYQVKLSVRVSVRVLSVTLVFSARSFWTSQKDLTSADEPPPRRRRGGNNLLGPAGTHPGGDPL